MRANVKFLNAAVALAIILTNTLIPTDSASAATPNIVLIDVANVSGVIIVEIDEQHATGSGVEADITVKNPLNLWQRFDLEYDPGVAMTGKTAVDDIFWGLNLIPPDGDLQFHVSFVGDNLHLTFKESTDLKSAGFNLIYILLELVPGVKQATKATWVLALNDMKSLRDILGLGAAEQDLADMISGKVSPTEMPTKVISLANDLWGSFARVPNETKATWLGRILSDLGIENSSSQALSLVDKIGDLFTVFSLCRTIADEIVLLLYTWETGGISQAGIYSAYQAGGLNPPGTPSPISPTNNTLLSTNRPTLIWTSVLNATQYIVQISASSDFRVMNASFRTGTASLALPSDLIGSTTWFWKVLALNGAGISSYSAVAQFQTPLKRPQEIPSDLALFTGYETIPDGSVVSPGQSLIKTWRVKNTGTSTWNGYKLKFTGGEQMGAPSEVTVPTTAPGQTVDISVSLVGPTQNSTHRGTWRLQNLQGTYFGPNLWVEVHVASSNAGGQITVFDISPASPSSASTVHMVGRIKPSADFRSMRFVFANQVQEMTNPKWVGDQYEISYDWNTASLARGNYAIAFEIAKTGDSDWARAERWIITYELVGSPVPTNRPPDRPALKSPYDWYLKDAAGADAPVELCAHPAGDPDGNAVKYWFEVKDQGGGVYATSGWSSSACWTSTFAPNTYSWRVKTGDGNAESDWSQETWHFSVAKGGVYIGSHSFFQQNTNETHMCVFVTYDGILAPEVYAWINLAPDNSENGEWRLLDHYGPNTTPDCTQPNYHGFWIRSPLYETGTHRIKLNAIKRDSGANATTTTSLDFAYIRPPEPNALAPSTLTNNGTWWNARTIEFDWSPSLRAQNYTLRASTNPNPWSDPAPVLNQVLGSGTTSYTYTFNQDYGQLYWSVRASNTAGSADWGGNVWFGIDQVSPSCQVEPLQPVIYENVFQVNWSGADNSAGVRSYDVQFRDSIRDTWNDWLLNAPASKPYELFTGQPGHKYFFRCRATDNAGNAGNFPPSADTSIVIDPFSRPGTPWWNAAYTQKRNIVLLNNMAGAPLPQGYPVHLHFDGSTTPTAAALYSASLSNPKCNDIRVVYNDAVELDRVMLGCSNSAIDIWFRSQVSIPAGSSNSTGHQLYYGYASAGAPPASQGNVYYPPKDGNTVAVWYMTEGQGSILYDQSGNGHNCSIYSPTSWVSPGKYVGALNFAGGGDSQTVSCGTSSAYNLQNFTYEFYFRSTGGNLWGRMAGNIQPSSQRWILEGLENKPSVWIWTTSGDSRTNAGRTYTDNLWHHLAFTVNGTQVRLYIDGQLETIGSLPANIRSADLPLTIGSAENIARTFAEITGVRLSNIARTDFAYGSFAAVSSEPSVTTGAAVTPPVTGNPDLALLSLDAYPSPMGGVLVQALVENQGDRSTESGFYTDLYLNHLPSGPGDYAGSLRFWINDPIEPGQTVTLTTVVSDLGALAPSRSAQKQASSVSSFTETSGTLYAQTDSAGLVQEVDNQDNIYSSGLQVCTATADSFENDDISATAKTLALGGSQIHNFDVPADGDWVKFSATAGTAYRLATSNLGVSSDTYLYLYGTDGTTLLTSNDDANGGLGSRIDWTAPQAGTYYVLVKHWNPNVGGCGTTYTLGLTPGSLTVQSAGAHDGWVLESTESSNQGGTMNAAATVFNVGDDALDKQYRAILSFNTGALPDTAVITGARLEIKRQGLAGTNPFTTHGGLKVDIRKPYFGPAAGLAISDFQAAAGRLAIGTFNKTPAAGWWYSAVLSPDAYPFINRSGFTQLRLRFLKDDNDDLGADYLKFYSGNILNTTYRPKLIITYTVP